MFALVAQILKIGIILRRLALHLSKDDRQISEAFDIFSVTTSTAGSGRKVRRRFKSEGT